jgi:aminopeptidase N
MGDCMRRAWADSRDGARGLAAGLLLECLSCTARPSASTAEIRTPQTLDGPRAPSAMPGPAGETASSSLDEGEPDITSYAVHIEIDLAARSVSGTATLRYSAQAGSTLRLPENALRVDGVRTPDEAVPFRIESGSLVIELPRFDHPPTSRGQPTPGQIEIAYHAQPARGLVFGPEFVYTDFFTCHWMPCKETPGDKASFRLELVVPAPWSGVASGHLVEKSEAGPGRTRFVWQEERPYSPYLYGFAVGRFSQATTRAGRAELQLFGADLQATAVEARFRSTEAMVRFLESKATVSLPSATYTQILVPGSAAQEKSSFSLIGRDELDPILSDPTEDWVIVHELAHQWWGNLITCKDWSHFWLNEGITSFMVAAYKEQRWGSAAYEHELRLSRERHQRAVDAHFDVKLAYAGQYPSLDIRRAIQYSKGVLFLHTLRLELGDADFWAGLGRFTRDRAGQSVESLDFEHDVEAATGRDLSALFRSWVYD